MPNIKISFSVDKQTQTRLTIISGVLNEDEWYALVANGTKALAWKCGRPTRHSAVQHALRFAKNAKCQADLAGWEDKIKNK